MDHKTWYTTDKSSWGPGPWQGEADKEQWQDETTGYPCLIKRSDYAGSLCGYVGVTPDHPWYGKHHDEIDVSAHGGLTYSDLCEQGPEDHTICHVPGPGEPEPLWWLGFDCGHAWDISPAREARERAIGFEPIRPGFGPPIWYWTISEVKAECASLAQQAADAAKE